MSETQVNKFQSLTKLNKFIVGITAIRWIEICLTLCLESARIVLPLLSNSGCQINLKDMKNVRERECIPAFIPEIKSNWIVLGWVLWIDFLILPNINFEAFSSAFTRFWKTF